MNYVMYNQTFICNIIAFFIFTAKYFLIFYDDVSFLYFEYAEKDEYQ